MMITSKVVTAVTVAKKTPTKQAFPSSIRFKENVDNMEKIHFRRYLQRRVKPPDPEVITLQDIKDVALFLANPKDLSAEFISYFHIPEVDRFLKAAIIYFHYYTQVWDEMILRREEAKRKLRQPIVTELEDIVRDNISDMRSMLAREYLEKIYASPEELLWENGDTFGLVGIPREEYDCMMFPRERTSKNFDKEILQPTYYKFPTRISIPDAEMPQEFPKTPCKWSESKQTTEARKHQCHIWRNFLLRHGHHPVRSASLQGSVENVHIP